jgi:hypothetical protein
MSRGRTVRRLSCCLTALVLLAGLGCRTTPPTPSPITACDLQAHVEFLASDLLEGRDAGQRGAEIAAQYVATQFNRLDLERVGDSWEMEFELRGGAGEATGELQLGEQRFTGASVVQAPRYSATAEVAANLTTGNTESPNGALVLADGVAREDERRVAKELLSKGAGGVVFIADTPWLDTASRRGRRRARERAPEEAKPADQPEPRGLSDLPPDLQDQVKDMLAGMDIDPGAGNVEIVVGGQPTSGAENANAGPPPENRPEGIQAEMITSGGGGFWSAAPRLTGPIVRVCQPLGQQLHAAADSGEPLTIRVTRPGHDKSANVLALVRGTDPQLKDEFVVIGAHYDHVGINSRGQVCNGADDNASGTAAMLGVAEALAARPVKPKRSILLAAWGAEEHGLIGSVAFGRNPPVPLDQIVAYVNLDMVGRNDPHEIEIGSASDTLKAWATQAAQAHGLTPKDIRGVFLAASDTAIFLQKEIPTIFFHSGLHSQLHTSADDPELIDADKMARVAQAACDLVIRTANEASRPAFTAPKPVSSPAEWGIPIQLNARPSGRMLGIYAEPEGTGDGAGARGIVPDSVAFKAGLKAGDRIVRIGERRIQKAAEIRAALEALPADAPFEIEVRRGEQTVILKGSLAPAAAPTP